MTGQAGILEQVKPCETVHVMLANGKVRTAHISGKCVLRVAAGKGTINITLKNVLVVAGLTTALVSVREAVSHAYTLTFPRRRSSSR